MDRLPIGELAGLSGAMAWAVGSLLFARIGSGSRVSAAAMNLGKSVVGGLVLLAIDAATAGMPLRGANGRDLAVLAASGVVGIAIGDTAFFGALVRVGPSSAVLLLSTAPLFVVAIDAARGIYPGAREAAGIALAVAGIALVVARGHGSEDDASARARRMSAAGVAFGLLAGLCQAVGSILSRAATMDAISPLSAAHVRLFTGGVAIALAGAAMGNVGTWLRELRPAVASVSAASLVGTVGGLWLSQIALARAHSAGIASTLLATSPIFALPLAHVFGHDRATPRALAGVVIAFAGIALLLWRLSATRYRRALSRIPSRSS